MKPAAWVAACLAATLVLSTAVVQAAGKVYLSSLPYTPAGLTYLNGGYFDGFRVDNRQSLRTMTGVTAFSFGTPMRIGKQTYGEGLLLHTIRGGVFKATWALNRRYSSLSAILGMDDAQDVAVDPFITVNFIGDGRKLGSATLDVRAGQKPPSPHVTIPLTGVRSLTIEIHETRTQQNGLNLDIVDPVLTIASKR